MTADTITHLGLAVVLVWSVVCAFGAFLMARDKRWDPLPPEEPDHH